MIAISEESCIRSAHQVWRGVQELRTSTECKGVLDHETWLKYVCLAIDCLKDGDMVEMVEMVDSAAAYERRIHRRDKYTRLAFANVQQVQWQ